jgi:23S rRNA (adenine2503-C2)-methyltransferase
MLPDDELRDELVPVNTRWPVEEAAGRGIPLRHDRPSRRVSIEYALMRDINDQAWRADLFGRRCSSRGVVAAGPVGSTST